MVRADLSIGTESDDTLAGMGSPTGKAHEFGMTSVISGQIDRSEEGEPPDRIWCMGCIVWRYALNYGFAMNVAGCLTDVHIYEVS